MSNDQAEFLERRHVRGFSQVRHQRSLQIRYEVRKNAGAERRRQLPDQFLERKKYGDTKDEETSSQDFEMSEVSIEYDMLFMIFVLVPAESFFRLQFLCKKWFGLINSPIFRESHALHSETVLICRKLTLSEPAFHKPKSYFHFFNLDRGGNTFTESSVVELVDVRASYNGLHIELPLGTEGNFYDESFDLAFCNEAKTYKVVHLFREKSRKLIGCKILNISTRKWSRKSEGPPSELFSNIRQIPVSVNGWLYWMPPTVVCDDFISMSLTNERFVSMKLPDCRKTMDKLVEIGENLGYVTYTRLDVLHVWILTNEDGGSGLNWIKKYIIGLDFEFLNRFPICGARNGKGLVLESSENDLYVYSFDNGGMEVVYSNGGELWFDSIDNLYIPHRNTLSSWEDLPHILR
ncbi:hypothetical protein ABFS83_03G119600 [Erythranthe nasuta]